MSDFVIQGFENFEVHGSRKRKAVSSSKMNAVKIFAAIFGILLICELCVYFFVVPCLDTVEISWSGLSSYSKESMNGVISSCMGKKFMNFSTNEAKSLVMSVPGVESVQISKRFPNKVYIHVSERKPVAMTFVSNGGRTIPVEIDKNGVLFYGTTNSANSDTSLPLISGIPVENIPEGMRIPQKYRALMEQIDTIRSLSQNYFAAVSEIHVIPKEYGNYELVLYPIHSKTRILTGRQLKEEDLQYMMVALDVVNALEPDVEEIDLRYGSVTYRTKSASRGQTGEFGE
ncbi:MAG: FtsQ-type POTRA domain-containing protein [Treponema sp.]|uniref:cell division protein FtsQ/DivIB n=1 Tax=Treponema sp. TaxID=166 RepID=UPI001B0D38FB|nr:FtsQ-type POTRA domain-containing protein [Treponema sp.]MBO6220119.1 FtsQ-type POTRA domain-containing protein [Treponema sp.]MBQ8680873.1 FtsQ-type POTRA domain-containing protein [Treponema sp.]